MLRLTNTMSPCGRHCHQCQLAIDKQNLAFKYLDCTECWKTIKKRKEKKGGGGRILERGKKKPMKPTCRSFCNDRALFHQDELALFSLAWPLTSSSELHKEAIRILLHKTDNLKCVCVCVFWGAEDGATTHCLPRLKSECIQMSEWGVYFKASMPIFYIRWNLFHWFRIWRAHRYSWQKERLPRYPRNGCGSDTVSEPLKCQGHHYPGRLHVSRRVEEVNL